MTLFNTVDADITAYFNYSMYASELIHPNICVYKRMCIKIFVKLNKWKLFIWLTCISEISVTVIENKLNHNYGCVINVCIYVYGFWNGIVQYHTYACMYVCMYILIKLRSIHKKFFINTVLYRIFLFVLFFQWLLKFYRIKAVQTYFQI